MATKFVPVYDPSQVFDLWEAGLLCNRDGITIPCSNPVTKHYYIDSWASADVRVLGEYGYWSEE